MGSGDYLSEGALEAAPGDDGAMMDPGGTRRERGSQSCCVGIKWRAAVLRRLRSSMTGEPLQDTTARPDPPTRPNLAVHYRASPPAIKCAFCASILPLK